MRIRKVPTIAEVIKRLSNWTGLLGTLSKEDAAIVFAPMDDISGSVDSLKEFGIESEAKSEDEK